MAESKPEKQKTQKPKRSNFSYLLAQGVLVIIALLGLLLLLLDDYTLFARILYSPYSFLVLVIMLLEYVVLKGLDRSRIYKLELKRLKAKREKDLVARRKLDEKLKDIEDELDKQDKKQTRRKIGEARKILRNL